MKFYTRNEFDVHDLICLLEEQWDIIIEAYTYSLPSLFVTRDEDFPLKINKLRAVGIIDEQLNTTTPIVTAQLKALTKNRDLATLTNTDRLDICTSLASKASDWQNKLTMRERD